VGKKFFAAVLTAVLALPLGAANAAALRDVFKRVSGSVVVVLAESKSPGAWANRARPMSADRFRCPHLAKRGS
jgi:hypothetical protein